jgi:hypothetical protein
LPEVKQSPGSPRPHNFGRYEVIDEIGDGAMGRVYRGFDPLVRRAVTQWRFEPARKQGVKVRVHWQVRQRFQVG